MGLNCPCQRPATNPKQIHTSSPNKISFWRARKHHKPGQPSFHVRAEPPLQELIVGGAVLTAVTAAFVNAFKGEPKVCDLCHGVGGTKCFACEGTGYAKVPPEKKLAPGGLKRDFVGRTTDPYACRVCGGSGRNLCSRCRGSGYLSSL